MPGAGAGSRKPSVVYTAVEGTEIMLISARVHYSCLALLELAAHADDNAPVSAGLISERHGIPGPFLNQLLRGLRSAGWVQSIRGSQGGYLLSVDPKTITLLDVVDELGCQETQDRRDGDPTPAGDVLQSFWDEANDAARVALSQKTLADLVQTCKEDDAVMFYI